MTTQHTYAPVDHPGVEVPDHLRSWDTPWADYAPVDITPPELRPGGMVDGGESSQEAALRELGEEAGLDLAGVASHTLARAYVPDRRATDHAWVATTAILYRLPEPVAVEAGDDAVQARWWPLTTAAQLVQDLAGDGGLYAAHHVLLGTAVAHLGGRP